MDMTALALLNGETACVCLVVSAALVLVIKLATSSRNRPSQIQPAPTMAPGGAGPADHQVSRNGAMLGTHTEFDLRQLLASGHYRPTDFYWRPGMTNWAPLHQLLTSPPGASAAGSTQPGQRFILTGTVISYNIQAGSGLISATNGIRYTFVTANWGSPTVPPSTGLRVEFEANGSGAAHIFPVHGQSGHSGSSDFYRSSDNVILSGVCAGLAHKWNTDPILIRIAMLFIPLGWIFYIIGSMSWSARPTR